MKRTIQIRNNGKNADLDIELTLNPTNEIKLDIDLNEVKKDYFVLSISGGVWNRRHNDYDTCGQILETIERDFCINAEIKEVVRLWRRWHLNDMKAGAREQSQVIEKWLKKENIRYDYTLACEYLKSIGLYEVKGYKYGHAWLVELIDEKDLASINQILSATNNC